MRGFVTKCLRTGLLLAMLLSILPAAVLAQTPVRNSPLSGPVQSDIVPQSTRSRTSKPLDAPNPFEYRRLRQREQLLAEGRTAEAAALAKTGKDNILIILVEFAGTDTATWSPEILGIPSATRPKRTFKPMAIALASSPRPRPLPIRVLCTTRSPGLPQSMTAPTTQSGRKDFGRQHYEDMLFGDGVHIQYNMANGRARHHRPARLLHEGLF